MATASYNFLFCIYTTATPATACTTGANNDAIWRESKSLTVTDGIFQTNLGDTTGLPGSVDFNSDNIFLGINFNSNGQMTPLVQFTASPYAFNADMLDGKDWTNPGTIGTSASSLTLASNGTSSWTNTAGNLTFSTTTSGILALTSAGALNLTAASASSVTLPNVTNAWNFDSNTLSIDALNNRIGIGTSGPTAFLDIAAPTTGAASVRLEASAGVNPSSPNIGDMWFNGTNLYFRKDGSTSQDLLVGGAGGYATIQDEGGALTQRGIVNFIGAGVNCVDNSGNTRTDCTIAGGSGGVSLATGSADVVNNGNSAIWINSTSTGNLLQLQKNGTDRVVVANNGGVTINGSDSSIVRQTVADFALGTVGSSLSNASDGLSLSDTVAGGIPNSGKGTITTGAPTTTAAIGAGAFSITRPNGKYLVIRGGGTNGMDIYDSTTETFTNSPQTLTGVAGVGAIALPRPGGLYRVLHGGGSLTSSLIDPLGAAPVGPSIAVLSKGAGTVAFLRADGRYLITNAPTLATTQIYDPIRILL